MFNRPVALLLRLALDLDISFIWDFVNNPPPDANGVRPDSTDVRLTFGLALDF